jgi:integrase
MNYSRVDKEIQAINKKLKAGFGRCSMRRVGGSLYLRATFPPKPGEVRPKSRELPLKMKATVGGLREALKKAIDVNTDLALDRFDWGKWLPSPVEIAVIREEPCTVEDWIALVREEYFDRRLQSPDTLQNWLIDYGYPYRQLPQGLPPTIKMLRDKILETDPGSKSRNRRCMAYIKLAKMAGLETRTLENARGGYRTTEVHQRDLPSLEEVIKFHERLPERVQFEFAIRAAFGLRPGEGARFCDFTNLKAERELSVFSTKTRESRLTYPYPRELFDIFELGDQEPVYYKCEATSVKGQTASFTKQLTKLGMPFNLYDLRHLYAWHTIKAGLDVRLAALFMGHSIEVHSKSYNKFFTKEQYRSLQLPMDKS